MIWVVAISLIFAVSAYLCAPFLAKSASASETEEIAAYRSELRAIQARIDAGEIDDAARAQRAVLQDRLLSAAKTDAPNFGQASWLTSGVIAVALLAGTVGIYGTIGAPNFTPETFQPPPPPPQQAQPDFAALLPQIEARLTADPNDATGWYLYGRTLMLVDQYENGLNAYARSLELNDNPDVRKEFEAAKTYAEQRRRGPSAEDIAAAQQMSPDDQQEMIRGMVSSLRARLEDTPQDAEGWTRLLRARKVLGQTEEARADIVKLRTVLPMEADSIISEAGWSN